jgi:general secretion pathway protein G
MKGKEGFTLIELLIVVIILGILAAIVIPQFSNASSEARESSLMSNLQSMRACIELYYFQHNDVYPGSIGGASSWANFVTHMTQTTDIGGNPGVDYGPYMRTGVPRNPINGLDTGIEGPIPAAPDDTTGWYYDSALGELRANSSGTGPSSGINYFDM